MKKSAWKINAKPIREGDRVQATLTITRVDGRGCLREGKIATALYVTDRKDCQIVAVRMDYGNQMGSIVVHDEIPLKTTEQAPEGGA